MTYVRDHSVQIGQLFREYESGLLLCAIDLPPSVNRTRGAPQVLVQHVNDPDREPEIVWESWLFRGCEQPTFCPHCNEPIWPGERFPGA